MSALKQSILNVAVLALAVVLGLGAYYAGSRIYHANQLYSALTEVMVNAKTIEGLTIALQEQQKKIDTLKSAKESADEQLKSLESDKQ